MPPLFLMLRRYTKNERLLQACVDWATHGRASCRFEQIQDWLQDDFEGVIIFDESHKVCENMNFRVLALRFMV